MILEIVTNHDRSYYKLGQEKLQIEQFNSHKKVIRNWTNFIRNWDRYYKAGQILQANAD